MKYWRGYLVAAIAAACSWGLIEFSKAHTVLVDMIYPYLTRMIQTYLAEWSISADFLVWEAVLMVLGVLVLLSIVLMILFKWNPIQWFGWITAVASLLFLLHTVIYGLNEYSGPLAEDIRLENAEYKYTITELEEATLFYRDQANQAAGRVSRDSAGNVKFDSFDKLARQAGEGFHILAYDQFNPVFAGCTLPVKELGFADLFSSRGITGLTVALTGESAVNPQTPVVGLPFAMCHEMSHRMAIGPNPDANMAAYLACTTNPDPQFQYSGYLMAFRYCYNALKSINVASAKSALQRVEAGMSTQLKQDLAGFNSFFTPEMAEAVDGEICDLLVIWHVEKYVLPLQEEEEVPFDPLDENAVDLSGIVNAKTEEAEG